MNPTEETQPQVSGPPTGNGIISKRNRVLLWSIAWALAVIVSIYPYPALLLTAFWFPTGIGVLASPFFQDHTGLAGNGNDGGRLAGYVLVYGLPFAGWIIYLVLWRFCWEEPRRRRFFIYYAILCVLLAVNMAGCRKINSDEWWLKNKFHIKSSPPNVSFPSG